MIKIELPRTTSFCDTQPNLYFGSNKLKIDYVDGESGDTVTVSFMNVYGFSFTESEYIDSTMFEFGCVEIQDSNFKEKYIESWIARGRDAKDSFGGTPQEIKHYRIYFDDFGMYDVLSKEISVELTT
jgi:hypothetical protein